MPADYDLIVVGNSAAGIYAAGMAADLRARVALVTQTIAPGVSPASNSWVLMETGRTLHQIHRAKQRQIWDPTETAIPPIWGQAQRWAKVVAQTEEALSSLAVVASLGVEVIDACGEFCRKPAPGFVVNGRYLRSRAYLLATANRATIPAIDGLQTTPYQTPETILAWLNSSVAPQRLAILGTDPVGVELAQSLTRLGLQVTLLVSSPLILPQEDPETANLIQAQLEAEGVQVLTNTPITQVRQIQEKTWVQAGNQAIETDGILLASGQEPTVAALNLEAVGVGWNAEGIHTNARLQTSNPRIYACINPTGYAAPHIDRNQAAIAVKNALFLPLLKQDPRSLPWVVYTDPEVARIGLTEPEAIRRYGKDILILRQYFKTLTRAHLQGETTGYCKLMVRRNGAILGAHLVGAQASEMIGAIALAMQQNLKIPALARLPLPSPTFSEIIQQTAAEWHRLRLERNIGLQDMLESCFSVRRSWFQ